MRVAAIVWCAAIAGLQVYLFRRVRDDLIKNHVEGPKGFRALLAAWSALGWCRVAGNEIRFWNGSRIYLCHCQDERDIYKYQGAEMHVLMIDELTHFTESMYRFLRNRVRMVGITLPPEYVGKFPRILCGGNPGNIGHLWVKNTFISGVEPLAIRLMPNSEGGMLRQYITARLEDNPSMAADDPGTKRVWKDWIEKPGRRDALGRLGCGRGRVFRLLEQPQACYRAVLCSARLAPPPLWRLGLRFSILNRLVGRRL